MLKKTLIATGLIAASATSFAAAAPMMGMANPWYVGVGLNYSALQTDNQDIGPVTTPAGQENIKLNSRGLGGQVFVGYHVNKYFGTELGLDFVGQNKYKNTSSGLTTRTAKQSNQWNVHFVGNAYLPVTSWFSPFAFAGVGYMNGKVDNGLPGNANEEDKLAGFGLVYGAGLQFNYQQFGVRVKYTRLDPGMEANNHAFAGTGGNTYDINSVHDYVSLDVLYRFGMGA